MPFARRYVPTPANTATRRPRWWRRTQALSSVMRACVPTAWRSASTKAATGTLNEMAL